ncbi:MAG: hypothetical protein BWK80_46695 [Desulfobacteraceae bacterium IS3]|nr:MAG: hypothetical protein BWK80_46695 [Desulfobacteraceae bacterium IS3]
MYCFRQGIFFKIFFISAFLLIFSLPAYTQEDVSVRTVNVIGTAEILNKNIAAAREQAISVCLISAVNAVALEFFPYEDMVHNFSKLGKTLYDDAGKFIRDYKILAEFRTEKTYRILLQATVISDRIKSLESQLEKVSVQKLPEPEKTDSEDAGAGEMKAQEILGEDETVQEKKAEASDPTAQSPGKPEPGHSVKAMPSVLFLLAEQNLEKDSFQYWWGGQAASLPSFSEVAICEIMRKKGFGIVSHGYRTSDGKGKSDLTYPPDLDNREAISMGTRMKAGVVIVGKSVVYKVSGAGPGEVAFSSTVSARAIRTDTGEEIAAAFQTSVKTGANETEGSKAALSEAGALAGEDLSRQIAKAWRKASVLLSETVPESMPSDTGEEKLPPENASGARLPSDTGIETATPDAGSAAPLSEAAPSDTAAADAPADAGSGRAISESPIAVPAAESPKPELPASDRPDEALSQKPGPIEIRVRGARNLGNFMNFRRTLTDIPGVKAIQTLEMKPDEASIGVNFDGNTASLADTLAVKIFELFYMKVYNVSENSITIDLIPK